MSITQWTVDGGKMVKRTRRGVHIVTVTVEDVILFSETPWGAKKYIVISSAELFTRQWNNTET